MLTSSSGTNYVQNEHEDVDQCASFAIPSKIMLYQSHPEHLVNQNEILIYKYKYHVNELMYSSGTNCVPNGHEDVDQYDSNAIPSKIMP